MRGWTSSPAESRRAAAAVALLLVAVAATLLGTTSGTRRAGEARWVDLGAVPGADQGFPPQGLTWANGVLIFSEHEADQASVLHEIDPATMALGRKARMPERATHTSGLAWDGSRLWAVDYATEEIFQLDREPTFALGNASVLKARPSGLAGASALAALSIDGIEYLAVTSFGLRGRNCIVRTERLLEPDAQPLPDIAELCFPNGHWSQGATWDGTWLLDAVNRPGRALARIDVYDVRDAVVHRDPGRVRRVAHFDAPGPGVEDLATDGERLWTSDERSFRFYRLDRLRSLLGRAAGDVED